MQFLKEQQRRRMNEVATEDNTAGRSSHAKIALHLRGWLWRRRMCGAVDP